MSLNTEQHSSTMSQQNEHIFFCTRRSDDGHDVDPVDLIESIFAYDGIEVKQCEDDWLHDDDNWYFSVSFPDKDKASDLISGTIKVRGGEVSTRFANIVILACPTSHILPSLDCILTVMAQFDIHLRHCYHPHDRDNVMSFYCSQKVQKIIEDVAMPIAVGSVPIQLTVISDLNKIGQNIESAIREIEEFDKLHKRERIGFVLGLNNITTAITDVQIIATCSLCEDISIAFEKKYLGSEIQEWYFDAASKDARYLVETVKVMKVLKIPLQIVRCPPLRVYFCDGHGGVPDARDVVRLMEYREGLIFEHYRNDVDSALFYCPSTQLSAVTLLQGDISPPLKLRGRLAKLSVLDQLQSAVEVPEGYESDASSDVDSLDDISDTVSEITQNTVFMPPSSARTIQIVQPDTKFDTGFGYAFSSLDSLLRSASYDYVSKAWDSLDAFTMSNDAIHAELLAIEHFCQNYMNEHAKVMWTSQNDEIVNLINSFDEVRATSPRASIAELTQHHTHLNPPHIQELIQSICSHLHRKSALMYGRWITGRIDKLTNRLSHIAGMARQQETKNTYKGLAGEAFPMGVYFTMTWDEEKRQEVRALQERYRAVSPRGIDGKVISSEALGELVDDGDDDRTVTSGGTLKSTADPSTIQIVQSDASGSLDHGYGYVWSSLDVLLESCRYHWLSRTFTPEERVVATGSGQCELLALRHFCVHNMKSRTQVLWISDSESMVNKINERSGMPRVDLIRASLAPSSCDYICEEILAECDRKQCTVRANWVPRQLNEVADYLSHLAQERNVRECTGVDDGAMGAAFPLCLFYQVPPTDARSYPNQVDGLKRGGGGIRVGINSDFPSNRALRRANAAKVKQRTVSIPDTHTVLGVPVGAWTSEAAAIWSGKVLNYLTQADTYAKRALKGRIRHEMVGRLPSGVKMCKYIDCVYRALQTDTRVVLKTFPSPPHYVMRPSGQLTAAFPLHSSTLTPGVVTIGQAALSRRMEQLRVNRRSGIDTAVSLSQSAIAHRTAFPSTRSTSWELEEYDSDHEVELGDGRITSHSQGGSVDVPPVSLLSPSHSGLPPAHDSSMVDVKAEPLIGTVDATADKTPTATQLDWITPAVELWTRRTVTWIRKNGSYDIGQLYGRMKGEMSKLGKLPPGVTLKVYCKVITNALKTSPQLQFDAEGGCYVMSAAVPAAQSHPGADSSHTGGVSEAATVESQHGIVHASNELDGLTTAVAAAAGSGLPSVAPAAMSCLDGQEGSGGSVSSRDSLGNFPLAPLSDNSTVAFEPNAGSEGIKEGGAIAVVGSSGIVESDLVVVEGSGGDGWARLWAAELKLLGEMGFTDTIVLVNLLCEHVGVPVSLQPDLHGVPPPDGIDRVVSILLG